MKQMKKRMITALTAVAMLSSLMWNLASAQTNSIGCTGNSPSAFNLVGLTETPEYLDGTGESGITPYGAAAPNLTTIYNIADGSYDFSGGAASWSTTGLYTNYYFTGSDSYIISVTNNTDEDVTMTFHGWVFVYRTVTLSANSTSTWLFSSQTADRDVSSSTKWYIHFSAPCDVEGTIKDNS